jgi:hypothetical protein
MRCRHQNALAWLLVVPVALCLAAGGAQAQVQMHLDLQVMPTKTLDNAIPPNCSMWNELYPVYGGVHHQDAYEDDGDGFISACDYIILDGSRWHIIWVGPTYFTTCGHGNQHYLEPTVEQTGENPVCETWTQVYPEYGLSWHIDDWMDGNANGLLDVCDIVVIPGEYLHIDRIGLNIIVEQATTAVEPSTWGRVKSLFNTLF